MIQYIYSNNRGPNDEKYYQLYGAVGSKELLPIFQYSDLVGMNALTTFNVRWCDSGPKLQQHFTQYGAWFPEVERTVIKEMKKLGLIEIEYKYKKKKD